MKIDKTTNKDKEVNQIEMTVDPNSRSSFFVIKNHHTQGTLPIA